MYAREGTIKFRTVFCEIAGSNIMQLISFVLSSLCLCVFQPVSLGTRGAGDKKLMGHSFILGNQ